MTPEVKERIEQIRNGNVPEGYKKVKTRVIPQEWTYEVLAPYLIQHHEVSDYSNQYPVLTSSRKGIFLQSDYYNKEIASEDNTGYNVVPRGYFTYRHMSDDEVFRFNINTIVDKGIVSTLYPVFTTSERIDDVFLRELLNGGSDFQRYAILQKQGGSRTYMYFDKLKKLTLPIPPLEEQSRIANILTVQDKVVELKEKLLTAKLQQKKYLMQQLLAGKKRLSGFDGGWMYVRANQIFKNVIDKKHNGTLEVLSATQDQGIIPRSQVDIDIKYAEESLTGYKKVVKGNFVISLRSFQGGIEYSEHTGIVSPAYTVLTSMCPIEDGYYKQFFKSTDYINRLNIAVYGIRDGKQISYDDFGRIMIPYPPLEEQKAIATVLATADKEIEILKRAVEQEKQKKKALMQLLLTGIVRV